MCLFKGLLPYGVRESLRGPLHGPSLTIYFSCWQAAVSPGRTLMLRDLHSSYMFVLVTSKAPSIRACTTVIALRDVKRRPAVTGFAYNEYAAGDAVLLLRKVEFNQPTESVHDM